MHPLVGPSIHPAIHPSVNASIYASVYSSMYPTVQRAQRAWRQSLIPVPRSAVLVVYQVRLLLPLNSAPLMIIHHLFYGTWFLCISTARLNRSREFSGYIPNRHRDVLFSVLQLVVIMTCPPVSKRPHWYKISGTTAEKGFHLNISGC